MPVYTPYVVKTCNTCTVVTNSPSACAQCTTPILTTLTQTSASVISQLGFQDQTIYTGLINSNKNLIYNFGAGDVIIPNGVLTTGVIKYSLIPVNTLANNTTTIITTRFTDDNGFELKNQSIVAKDAAGVLSTYSIATRRVQFSGACPTLLLVSQAPTGAADGTIPITFDPTSTITVYDAITNTVIGNGAINAPFGTYRIENCRDVFIGANTYNLCSTTGFKVNC